MTAPRIRRRRRAEARSVPVDDELLCWFRGEPGAEPGWIVLLDYMRHDLVAAWRSCREAVIAEHVANAPGTRPRGWWCIEANEPRQRLGGIGDAEPPERQHYALGLPIYFARPEWPEEGTPPDSAFPPLFESEAGYLRRLRLLLPGEARRLGVKDYRPVAWSGGGEPDFFPLRAPPGPLRSAYERRFADGSGDGPRFTGSK